MWFLCFPAKWRFKGTSNSITDSNIIVRLQCMKNLNYPEGADSIYRPSLKTTIARHRGHKEVTVARVTCNIWKKNFLTLQRVETLLKSVGADALILYKRLCTALLVNGMGPLPWYLQAGYQGLTKHTDFPLPVLTQKGIVSSLVWYLLYTPKENFWIWKMMD